MSSSPHCSEVKKKKEGRGKKGVNKERGRKEDEEGRKKEGEEEIGRNK